MVNINIAVVTKVSFTQSFVDSGFPEIRHEKSCILPNVLPLTELLTKWCLMLFIVICFEITEHANQEPKSA